MTTQWPGSPAPSQQDDPYAVGEAQSLAHGLDGGELLDGRAIVPADLRVEGERVSRVHLQLEGARCLAVEEGLSGLDQPSRVVLDRGG